MKRAVTPALLLAAFLTACLVFYLCYQYDNKYTAPGEGAVTWLVRDWEIYRDSLLSPEDFTGADLTPDETIYIGQYGGFEKRVDGTLIHGPHGSATYRLTVELPPETRSYTLELPEIYSAYRLYINGTLLAQMGDPDPNHYHPRTGNSAVTVQAADSLEIIIAVSNFSHFYSGLFYPPALGEPDAAANILNTRLTVRLIADVLAFGLGLLYLGVWFLTRKEKTGPGVLPLYYALLCACFVLYTCYPIVKTLLPGGMAWYTVENVAYCALFLFIMLICRRLTGAGHSDKWFRLAEAFAVFVCCWAVLMPFLAGDNLNMMVTYSRLIEWYSWVCAAYLTANAVYGVIRGRMYSKAMLTAMMVFNAALVMDITVPIFEPIRFGWFTEIAGGFVVLMLGVVLAGDIARQYRLRQAMENRVESVTRMLDVQRAYLPILEAKEEETRVARHDMRHHITAIRQLVPPIPQTEKLAEYLDTFDDTQLQPVQMRYCSHDFANMLLSLYAGLARRQDTSFLVRAALPKAIPVSDVDLCVVLSNLLENALEASVKIPESEREIMVNIACKMGSLGIFIKNRFDGVLDKKDGRFLSRKQTGRVGIGLASAEAVCERHGGYADFYSDESDNVFHAEIAIPIEGDGEA